MSSVKKTYRIVPVRDLKLRKIAIFIFIIISFVGLISFFWVPDLSLSIPFLYMIYVFITLYTFRFAKNDIFSPLSFFIFFSFFGFSLKLLFLSISLYEPFFAKGYHYNFQYNGSTISLAFAVFLIGYVSFIIGFNAVKKGLKLKIYERLAHPFMLTMLSVILIIASFYFRSRYLVGIPGYNVALIEHAGYLYYPLLYGAIIVTDLAYYTALVRNSRFYTIAGLLLFVLSALLEALLGWKGGSAIAILLILLIYYYVNQYKQHVRRVISKYIITILLILIFLFVLLYPVVTNYRYAVIISGDKADLSNFSILLREYKDVQSFDFSKTLLGVFGRFSGLDNLVGIVSYNQQGISGHLASPPSFFLNLFGMGIQPEQFYTWYILGVDPNIITTSAPTGWGALYIYGGIIGVMIGMLLIGMLSKLLYLTFLTNILRDGRWIIFYAIFMIKIFWPVVFEGTIVNYGTKHFISLLVIYSLFIIMLNILHQRLYAK